MAHGKGLRQEIHERRRRHRNAYSEPRKTGSSKLPVCTNGSAICTSSTTSTCTVYKGERIVICGPSGSGKSTLIRCINRLEEHQKGRIVVDGIELTNNLKNIEKIREEVGMVFQHFNLFPHLTILENLRSAPSG